MGHWYLVHWFFEMGATRDAVAAIVTSVITIPLGVAVGYVPYKHNRKRQQALAAKLDASIEFLKGRKFNGEQE